MAVTVFALPSSFVNYIRASVASILNPIHQLSCALADSLSPGAGRERLPSHPSDNAKLQEHISLLRAKLLRTENEKYELIRKLHSLAETGGERLHDFYRPLVANVIIPMDSSPWRQSFVIDKGSADGVEPGQPVVWRNHLLGKVSHVGLYASRVQSITDPHFKALARIVHENDTRDSTTPTEPLEGILEGCRDLMCRMKWVPRIMPVQSGALILVSPRDPNLPHDLVIGELVTAEAAQSGFSYAITVRPMVNPTRLTSVVILRK